jgi:hypothetical protein
MGEVTLLKCDICETTAEKNPEAAGDWRCVRVDPIFAPPSPPTTMDQPVVMPVIPASQLPDRARWVCSKKCGTKAVGDLWE